MKTTFFLVIMTLLCFGLSAQTKDSTEKQQEITKKAGVKTVIVTEYLFVDGKLDEESAFKTSECEYDRNGNLMKEVSLHRSEYIKYLDSEFILKYKNGILIEMTESMLVENTVNIYKYSYEGNKMACATTDKEGKLISHSTTYSDNQGRDTLSIYIKSDGKYESYKRMTYDSIGLKEEIETGTYPIKTIRTNNDPTHLEFDIYENDTLVEKLTEIYDQNDNCLEFICIEQEEDGLYFHVVSKYNEKNLCIEDYYYDNENNIKSVEIYSYTYW